MKHTIKCDECGKKFTAESQNYGNIKCSCPYCGYVMSSLFAPATPFLTKARKIALVRNDADLYGADGKRLQVVKAEAIRQGDANIIRGDSDIVKGKREKRSFWKRTQDLLIWTGGHLSVFFSWSSERIDNFREKYEDADQWLFVGFSLLFIIMVFLGLFVFAETTKLIASGQSWLFRMYCNIMH